MKITKSQLKQIIKEELQAVVEDCWDGYERVPGTREGAPGSCRKKGSVNEEEITDAEEEELKLDYSDVLFRPKRSTLQSRKDVNLKRTYTIMTFYLLVMMVREIMHSLLSLQKTFHSMNLLL